MRDTSSRSSISRACAWALRSTFSSARSLELGRQRAGAQQPRPAEDRVERRAQLVRQRGEKLVLEPVRLAQLRLALLDPVQHAVEGVDERAELVVGHLLRANRIVAARRHIRGRLAPAASTGAGHQVLQPRRQEPARRRAPRAAART